MLHVSSCLLFKPVPVLKLRVGYQAGRLIITIISHYVFRAAGKTHLKPSAGL